MKIFVCLLALLAITTAFETEGYSSAPGAVTYLRNLKAAASNDEGFPAWNPKEIEGWDKMNKTEQAEVKQFYDSLKELYDALDALDKELDKLDSPKGKPAVNNKPATPANKKTRMLDRQYPTGSAAGRPQGKPAQQARPQQA